jgi:hypothetical protein
LSERLRFEGFAYNVRERVGEAVGLGGAGCLIDPDHWEYEIVELGTRGVWDSLFETYNGVQRLSEDEAEEWARETAAGLNSGEEDAALFGFRDGECGSDE